MWLNVVKWKEQHYKRVENEIQITYIDNFANYVGWMQS
jgi:hypothetical protein